MKELATNLAEWKLSSAEEGLAAVFDNGCDSCLGCNCGCQGGGIETGAHTLLAIFPAK